MAAEALGPIMRRCISMLLKQDIVDKVSKHLMTQLQLSGTPDSNNFLTCMYRGPDGLKCAIGCLIPDDMYHESFESLSITMLAKNPKDPAAQELMEYLGIDNLDLLSELQQIHDHTPTSLSMESIKYLWSVRLNKIIVEYGLEVNSDVDE